MSEMIGCPACDPFDAFVHSVSQITGVVKRCGALILEMTNGVQIFHGLSDKHEDQRGCLCW